MLVLVWTSNGKTSPCSNEGWMLAREKIGFSVKCEFHCTDREVLTERRERVEGQTPRHGDTHTIAKLVVKT